MKSVTAVSTSSPVTAAPSASTSSSHRWAWSIPSAFVSLVRAPTVASLGAGRHLAPTPLRRTIAPAQRGAAREAEHFLPTAFAAGHASNRKPAKSGRAA